MICPTCGWDNLPGNEECGNCQQYLGQMRTTIELTGELSPEALSPEAERTLLETFRSWRS